MNKSQEAEDLNNKVDPYEEDEIEYGSVPEELFVKMVKAYEHAYNNANDKHEIEFHLTITKHKVPTEDGNKDVCYFRVDRGVREKGNEEWDMKPIHQDMYVFRDLKEQLNPNAPWKEQLYLNAITKLVAAGLEYAELLMRMKNMREFQKEDNAPKTEEQQTEERLNKLGLVGAKEIDDKPLPGDPEYKAWLQKERKKEGLT